MFQRFHHTWIPGLLLFAYTCIQIYCIQQLSINYDEGSFAAYGRTILKGDGNKDVLRYDSKLPVSALNMLPRAVEQVFHPGLKKTSNTEDVIRGRYVSLVATLLLALLVYQWASRLYGRGPALLSLLLFLLCPNFLAHGIFLSSDIFACLFMALSFYYCWRFRQTRRTAHFLLMALSVAGAQVSKFSMVHLLLLVPLLLLIGWMADRKRPAFKQTFFLFLLFVFTNWLVISGAHLFYGMFIPLGDYHFSSAAFQHIQGALPGISHWLPVPLPAPYIRSMDIVMYFDQLGGGVPGSLNGAPYILGQHSTHGFWYYYFVTLWYKLPIPFLLLLFITTALYIRNGCHLSMASIAKDDIRFASGRRFLQHEMYLIVPVLYYLIYMNFFYGTQIGIRHILIILPLLYVFGGFFAAQATTLPGQCFGYAMLVYACISVGCRFPHFLPYTNELITDKKMAYTKLADTNIGYGEGEKFLQSYLRRHPDAIYQPHSIMPGRIVMEVNNVVDMEMGTLGRYNWVAPLVPVDHIHSQYLVYDISAATADSLIQKNHRQP